MSGLTSDQKFAGGDHVTPEVLWAQRSSSSDPARNFIYLTISAPDVPASSMKLDLKPTGLTFTGHSDTKKLTYHVSFEFYAEIDPEESKVHHTARDVELVLRKKELNEEYWPRLTKEKQRLHYLKTDFDKWVDEDEQDTLPDDDMMNQFGGGMGGMGGDGGFGGIDFSKLGGGAGGMGGMGGLGGTEGLGGLGGDDSDDDLPDLEDENEGEKEGESAETASGETGASATKTAAGGKIEEVS